MGHVDVCEPKSPLENSIETLDGAELRQMLRDAALDGAAAVAIVERIAEVDASR